MILAGSSWAVDIRDSCKYDGSDGDSTDNGYNSSANFMYWGLIGGVNHNGCMHFDDVQIPNGATINSAVIEWKSALGNSENIVMEIYGYDADNVDTADYDDDGSYFASSNFTSASAAWSFSDNTTTGSWYQTSDFSSVVKEIVDRAGWSSGNSMCIFVMENGSGNNKEQTPYTYDNAAADAPKLLVSYTEASAESGTIMRVTTR